MDLKQALEQVAAGGLSPEQAIEALGPRRLADLGYAKVDLDRPRRCGMPEVIYCAGKTSGQIIGIMQAMRDAGHNAMGTRLDADTAREVCQAHPEAVYHPLARAITLDAAGLPEPEGQVAIVCAGTSDLPVADEAALIAERMGARVVRVNDAGVAGLHRLTRHLDLLRESRALVVVAGMEGALPSVVGGLVDRPIVAVPTSVGYGMNFNGLSALLAMLNSCVPGIVVVNVDNGLGAGVAAAMINRSGRR